ncbi:MAG TPA: helix-hairpin-helix domain-containing protein [Cryomorphaceae bacterium]|nr:helix-hairpin-helix domain-containing protein [Cryomorphaceae bacterium]
MLSQFKSYFEHNRAERNGSIAILIIIVVVLLGTRIFSAVYQHPAPDAAAFEAYVDSVREAKLLSTPREIQPSLFLFNPNELSDSGFAALGFSPKEIQTLRNYQEAGGEFSIKSDVGKLFFVDDKRYEMLEPYIDLPKQLETRKKRKNNNRQMQWSDTANYHQFSNKPRQVDINYTDTNELKEVRGIGSFYAKRIIEYGEELGGYYTIGQIMELWNMTPEKMDVMAPFLTADPGAIEKINVNTATAQELAGHPYISFKLASSIVNYRETNGPFENRHALCASGLLNDELCSKLAAYLRYH